MPKPALKTSPCPTKATVIRSYHLTATAEDWEMLDKMAHAHGSMAGYLMRAARAQAHKITAELLCSLDADERNKLAILRLLRDGCRVIEDFYATTNIKYKPARSKNPQLYTRVLLMTTLELQSYLHALEQEGRVISRYNEKKRRVEFYVNE